MGNSIFCGIASQTLAEPPTSLFRDACDAVLNLKISEEEYQKYAKYTTLLDEIRRWPDIENSTTFHQFVELMAPIARRQSTERQEAQLAARVKTTGQ